MRAKILELLDKKGTWVAIATFAGMFGEKAFGITNAVGALVMAAI